MINPTYSNINRLFVLSFKTGGNDPMRDCFDKHYMLLIEIKDFNALINNKPFSDQPIRSKRETYKKLIEMSRNNLLYNRQLIRLLISSKLSLVLIYQNKKYKYFSTN